MLLIALLLGVGLAWLAKTGWNWRLDRLRNEHARERWRVTCNRLGYTLAFVLVLSVGTVYVLGVIGDWTGDWSSPFVQALGRLTIANVQRRLVAFALGIIVVAKSDKIKATLAGLLAVLRPRPQSGANAAEPQGSSYGGGAAATYPWLTGIVGIAAVTLVALVTLVIFFPDILLRLESLKVAGVEARFATAATRSVRLIQAERTDRTYTANFILNAWATYEGMSKQFFTPAQDVVSARSGPDQHGDDVRTNGDIFMKEVAKPLADAVSCFSKYYELRDTELQHVAVRAANDWGNLFLAVATSRSKDQSHGSQDQNDASKDQTAKAKLHNAVAETFELIFGIYQDLMKRDLKCSSSATAGPPEAPNVECERSCKDDPAVKKKIDLVVETLEPHLTDIPAYGFAVAFVSDLELLTTTPERDLEFLENIAPYVDNKPHTLIAQAHFFFKRARAKLAAHVRAKDTIEDLRQARSLVNDIISITHAEYVARESEAKAITPNAKVASNDSSVKPDNLTRILSHYCFVSAVFVNQWLSSMIEDWLQGWRLSPQQLEDLEGLPLGGQGLPLGGLPYELSEWANTHPVNALLIQVENDSKEPDESKKDLTAVLRILTIASVYDTLAMREIAVGVTRNDLTKDRCARISALLAQSRDILNKLHQIEYLKITDAHYSVYESVCSQ